MHACQCVLSRGVRLLVPMGMMLHHALGHAPLGNMYSGVRLSFMLPTPCQLAPHLPCQTALWGTFSPPMGGGANRNKKWEGANRNEMETLTVTQSGSLTERTSNRSHTHPQA